MVDRKPRVAVLMGGPSAEYAISLKSGHGVAEALARRGWKAAPLVIPKTLSMEETLSWTRSALQELDPAVAFLALHGPFGEDGTIQVLCEEVQLAYTGSSSSASRLGMDKPASRGRFLEAGLQVPISQLLPVSRVTPPSGSWSFPLIVKPVNQGSSIGISKVSGPQEFARALRDAGQYSDPVIIEEFVAGREVTVSVIGEHALPVVEVIPKHGWFDFAAKYTEGLTEYLAPAPLTETIARRVREVGLRAHHALGCRHFSRTDIILTEAGEPVVLEVNTIPGLTPMSLLPKAAAVCGMSYEDVCERLVAMALADCREPISRSSDTVRASAQSST